MCGMCAKVVDLDFSNFSEIRKQKIIIDDGSFALVSGFCVNFDDLFLHPVWMVKQKHSFV